MDNTFLQTQPLNQYTQFMSNKKIGVFMVLDSNILDNQTTLKRKIESPYGNTRIQFFRKIIGGQSRKGGLYRGASEDQIERQHQ